MGPHVPEVVEQLRQAGARRHHEALIDVEVMGGDPFGDVRHGKVRHGMPARGRPSEATAEAGHRPTDVAMADEHRLGLPARARRVDDRGRMRGVQCRAGGGEVEGLRRPADLLEGHRAGRGGASATDHQPRRHAAADPEPLDELGVDDGRSRRRASDELGELCGRRRRVEGHGDGSDGDGGKVGHMELEAVAQQQHDLVAPPHAQLTEAPTDSGNRRRILAPGERVPLAVAPPAQGRIIWSGRGRGDECRQHRTAGNLAVDLLPHVLDVLEAHRTTPGRHGHLGPPGAVPAA